MNLIESAKKAASIQAIEAQVKPNQVIGIGSGSTIVYAIQHLAKLHSNGMVIKSCIPSSFQAQVLILEYGLPLGSLNQFPEIDVAFDGADEVDPSLNCIKGGGACHLLEKLVISNSKKTFIVADHRKESKVLGSEWKKGVPIEVVPQAYKSVMRHITEIGGVPLLRMAVNKAGPVVTDSGNFVVDADFGLISDPANAHLKLIQIVGVVETGLFCGMVDGCYFGMADGSVKTQFPQ